MKVLLTNDAFFNQPAQSPEVLDKFLTYKQQDQIRSIAETKKPVKVPFKQLIPTNQIDTNHLEKVKSGEREVRSGYPIIVKHDGKNYIYDGHHRLVLNPNTKVQVVTKRDFE